MRCFTVGDEADLKRVWRLTYREYLAMNYCLPNPSEMLTHFLDLDRLPQTQVFALEDDDGELIATNSASLDGPGGLHTDHAWPEETQAVRRECRERGLRLGSSWRIVTDSRNRQKLKPLLTIIDYTLQQAGPQQDVTLFTFHFDHSRIYTRLLGLEVIAGPRPDATVHGANGVLMRGEAAVMRERWAETMRRRG